MALGTLGTTSTTALWALNAWAASLSEADIAAIAQGITNDADIAAILGGAGAGATAVIAQGDTHTSTTIDSLTRVSGAALASIMVGDLVVSGDVPPGTYVAAKPTSTSVTLSQAAADTASAAHMVFVRPSPAGLSRNAQLVIPNRGILKVLPGDVVAVDSLGWPILVSGASIGTAGSQWNKV